MTTIVRYKNHLVGDNRYLNLQGASVITRPGPAKFFKHETGKAYIGISGGISNHAVWQALAADFSQTLIDLDNYPSKLPSFSNTLRLIEDKGKDNSVIQRGDAGIPHFMIATKDWTVTVLTDGDHIKNNKPMIGVYGAHDVIAIGSGGDFVSMQIPRINSKRTLITALQSACHGDPLTGGTLFYTEMNWGEQQ